MEKVKSKRFSLTNSRCIRETSFTEFAELLVQHNPQRFGKIISDKLTAASLYLHYDLEVTATDLERLWIHILCEYKITVCEIHQARAKYPWDMTLLDLYKLLLHSEDMKEIQVYYQRL